MGGGVGVNDGEGIVVNRYTHAYTPVDNQGIRPCMRTSRLITIGAPEYVLVKNGILIWLW